MFLAGFVVNLRLLMPVFRWQRRDNLLAETDPAATELARSRALRMPFYRTLISVVSWAIGGVVFIVASWSVAQIRRARRDRRHRTGRHGDRDHRLPAVRAGAAAGGRRRPAQRCAGERPGTRRHPAADADLDAVHRRAAAGDRARRGGRQGFPAACRDRRSLFNPILLLALAALGIGLVSTLLVAMSIADPLRQLRWALSEVQRGNYNAHMQIYDASELGLLQAGFNDMVRDLSERQRLRDLFGRYVGEDVARRALERGTELGGQERDVAVLFVDLVGSTQLAATRPPAEVVHLLNEFFRVVVDTVGRHGGFVNKFQGDAALAIFGAPIEHPDGVRRRAGRRP